MSDPIQVSPGGDGPNWKIPVLFGGVIALLGANIYLFTQLDAVRTEAGEFRKTTNTEIASLKESSTVCESPLINAGSQRQRPRPLP